MMAEFATRQFTYAIKERAPGVRAKAYAAMLANLPSELRVHMLPFEAASSSSSSSAEKSSAAKSSADFVWQNKSTMDYQELRRSATVYNHLCGAGIFEDKAKLALLLMDASAVENSLESYVFSSVVQFSKWCRTTSTKWGKRLWVAKTPMGNSGSGVWMLSSGNYKAVTDEILTSMLSHSDSRYAVVVQEYVLSPLLWRGRKLQFRIYAIITGDMSCWIYRHGMLQFCNKEYQQEPEGGGDGGLLDDEVHITNVCRNVHNPNLFVREKPVDLVSKYPLVYQSMIRSLQDLVQHSSPYLSRQRSRHHFEFIGCDYIVDVATQTARLIECNCPPNNTGSDPIGTIEDFHHDLWEDVMNAFVLTPIVKGRSCKTRGGDDVVIDFVANVVSADAEKKEETAVMMGECECGLFERIREPSKSVVVVTRKEEEESQKVEERGNEEKEKKEKKEKEKEENEEEAEEAEEAEKTRADGGTAFIETREPSELAMNQLTWLVWEKKAAKRNMEKGMSM